MTDLTPNDLSHLSDEDFMSLCPQGEHAPGAEPLSPAQAVMNGLWDADLDNCQSIEDIRRRQAAAALRAVADQDETLFDVSIAQVPAVRAVRTEKILAIAAELEGQ